MANISAGILLYRRGAAGLEVFLIHMGGPFWARKDAGAWSIPKGLIDAGEDPLTAARREFREETGAAIEGNFLALTPVKQPGGKVVHAWAVEGDLDAESIISNTFSIERPAGSGRWRSYPEADRAAWCSIPEALEKVAQGQRALLRELTGLLGAG